MRLVAGKLATGVSARQAAQELGNVSHQTVSRWIQLPSFQSYLSERLEQHESECNALLKSLRFKAIQRLGDLLESNNQQISLRASEAVLDRQKMVANTEFRQDSSAPISVGQILRGLGVN